MGDSPGLCNTEGGETTNRAIYRFMCVSECACRAAVCMHPTADASCYCFVLVLILFVLLYPGTYGAVSCYCCYCCSLSLPYCGILRCICSMLLYHTHPIYVQYPIDIQYPIDVEYPIDVQYPIDVYRILLMYTVSY